MYDDEGYYVVLPDPEMVAEDYFAGLRAVDVINELDRLAYQSWVEDMMFWEEQQRGEF